MKKLMFTLGAVVLIFHAVAQESDCKLSYDKLKENLSHVATHRYLSAFVNLDYRLSELRLQEYILDSMDLAMGDHIAVYHINDNLYKIVITDNGRNFNYKCNFRE